MRILYQSALAIAYLFATSDALTLDSGNTIALNTSMSPSMYHYSKKRCNARRLRRADMCDDCSKDRETGTCSWSFPIDDPDRWRSWDAACRCNPHEFFFSKREAKRDTKCGDDGCPDKNDGYGEGTCHRSYPWYDPLKWKSDDVAFRCKYPLEMIEDDESDGENDEESDGENDNESNGENGDETSGDIDSYNQANLDLHNHFRSLHVDTPPLEFSQELADAARVWSTRLDQIGRLEHDPNSDHGENLGWSTWSNRADDWATRHWYEEEIDLYDYNNPGFSSGAGHFTQVIWVGTKKVGCAEVGEYTTCRYEPAGNITNPGYFEANVKPLKQ